jgi:phospholipase A-2-activating protein
MFNKILAINKTMISSGRKDAAFNPDEESVLGALRESLESSKPLPQRSLDLVVRLVTSWPYGDRLPGLDLLRCVAKFPLAAAFTDPTHGSLLDLAVTASLPSDGSAPNENAVMMGLRTIANLFSSANGRSVISADAETAIGFLERVAGLNGGDAIGPFNRNVMIAFTTVGINLSVLAHRERLLTVELRRRLYLVLGAILKKDQTDSEVLYRALVALGTLLSASTAEAANLGIAGWIQAAGGRSSEDRVKSVAAECSKLAPR